MAFNTYDPSKVFASFAGITIDGWAPDTFLSVTHNADMWNLSLGADGKQNTRSKNLDQSGQATFTLQKASIANDLLSALATADRLSNTGIGSLIIRDSTTGISFFAKNAYIKKMPDSEFGTEHGTTEWLIETDKLEAIYGDPATRV